MAARAIAHCTICEKPFKVNPAKANKFCGLPCYRVAQRAGSYRRGPDADTEREPCANCGVEVVGIKTKKRDGTRATHKFCARRCYDEYRAKIIADRAVACLHCGASSAKASERPGRLYCSDVCWKAARKAKPATCVNCGCLFTAVKWFHDRKRYVSANGYKTCSDACTLAWRSNNQDRKDKISTAFTGPSHPNWQGGSHKVGFRGAGWQSIRRETRKRAQYRCEHCGMEEAAHIVAHGQTLHVNHKTPYHQHASGNPNRPSNLEALCVSCHMKADWAWRKKNPVQMTLMRSLS